jgi:imidazolonepropionase-like amidohydrolase
MDLSMRRYLLLLMTLLFAPTLLAEPVAFINVNVVPMSTETVIEQQTVVIEDGIIVSIGPVDDVPIPEDAEVIDGTDRFLMPGLAEMHAHVPGAGAPALERYFDLYVANGVTTIRGMLGQASHLALRQRLQNGQQFGPRLITSGPSLNGRSVAGMAQARQLVREQKDSGYDFIKIHPGLSSDEFDAIAETANAVGIPYAGHVPVAAGVERALQLGMATIDHLDGYFAALLPARSIGSGGYGGFFDVMLANELEADRIPDIARTELRNRPEMRYMPTETVARWVAAKESQLAERDFDPDIAARAIELRRHLIFELHRAGAGLLLGSDSPQIFNVPGFATHRELDALVGAGLTPYEALRTGTVAVGEFLGSDTGIVAVGLDADLILLNANPLVDIRNSRRIHGVMLRGVWYASAELAVRLARYVGAEN